MQHLCTTTQGCLCTIRTSCSAQLCLNLQFDSMQPTDRSTSVAPQVQSLHMLASSKRSACYHVEMLLLFLLCEHVCSSVPSSSRTLFTITVLWGLQLFLAHNGFVFSYKFFWLIVALFPTSHVTINKFVVHCSFVLVPIMPQNIQYYFSCMSLHCYCCTYPA